MTKTLFFRTIFILAIVAGIVLRLCNLDKVTFNGDQKLIYDVVKNFTQTGEIPLVGMYTSAGGYNAGLSYWNFISAAFFLKIKSPVELAFFLALINIVFIIFMVAYAWKYRRSEFDDFWLPLIALLAANPIYIYWSADIWIVGFVPLYAFALYLAWRNKSSSFGSFLWGLFAALIGQAYLNTYIFAFTLTLFTILKSSQRKVVRWKSWFVGSVLGTLPLIPLIHRLVSERSQIEPITIRAYEVFELRYLRAFLTDAFGSRIDYIFTTATALIPKKVMAFTHALNLLLGLMLLGLVFKLFSQFQKKLFSKESVKRFIENDDIFYLFTCMFGMLLVVSSLRLFIFRHYIIAVFPMTFFFAVLISRYVFQKYSTLFISVVVVFQIGLSVGVEHFIKDNCNKELGDYGKPYACKVITPSHE